MNPTQNHSDSPALMKRVPGDTIEARQDDPVSADDPLVSTPVIVLRVFIVGAIILSLLWINTTDNPVRGNDIVEHLFWDSD